MLKLTISLLALLGLADASYLTLEHYLGEIPVCSVAGCEQVLTSQYAVVMGVPIALAGALYYLTILILSRLNDVRAWRLLLILSSLGVVSSAYLVYLQLVVIKAICVYCMVSAGATLLIFILVFALHRRQR